MKLLLPAQHPGSISCWPILKSGVVRYATFESDWLEPGASRRLASGARIAPLAVLYDFGCALERADFADAGHVLAIPFHPEFEILVWIMAVRVHGEFSHFFSSMRVGQCSSREPYAYTSETGSGGSVVPGAQELMLEGYSGQQRHPAREDDIQVGSGTQSR